MSETETPTQKKVSLEELGKIVEQKMSANPGIKTAMLAQTLGVPERAILRVMPDDRAKELDGTKMEELIRDLESLGLLYVVVRNPAVVSETRGRFGGFSNSGPFFNVAGQNIHMHLMMNQFTAVYAVTVDGGEDRGIMYSFQFFQPSGVAALKVFLIKSMQEEAGDNFEESAEKFKALVEKYPHQ